MANNLLQLSYILLLGLSTLISADSSNPDISKSYKECDAVCYKNYLSYGFPEGYAKYTCCLSYRLHMRRTAQASELNTINLECDQDCFEEYKANGFSEEITVNKCCYRFKAQDSTLSGSQSDSNDPSLAVLASSDDLEWEKYRLATEYSSLNRGKPGAQNVRDSMGLKGWQIGVIVGCIVAVAFCAIHGPLKELFR